MNAALQRKNMVESQVRPSDVTDRRITAAMTTVPRELFVPENVASFAYSDENLTIAPGCTILAPRVLAKLVQLAEAEQGDSVLVVGGCCGYAAAILAQISANVVAVFADKNCAAAASAALSAIKVANVTVLTGTLASGWSPKAPYDVILVEGGVEAVPEALETQLAEGGRLVAVGADRGIGRAFQLRKRAGLITRRDAFQAAAPVLPGFDAVRDAFVF